MGFSVSGSAAIVFLGIFIAFGMWYSAAANGFERVSDAQQAQANDNVEQKNTAINITSVDYRSNTLVVKVNNTGGTHISLNETDVVVDNGYETGWRDGADVNSDEGTYLWLPGEQLNVSVSKTSQPDRVKVATQYGVAETEVLN